MSDELRRKREIEDYAREAASKPIFGTHSRKEDDAEAEYRKAMKENAPYITLGFQMAMTIALGALVGWWLEGPDGNGMGIGIGAGIGSVLGLGYFLKTVLTMEKKNAEKQKRDLPTKDKKI
jgi:hypothetical protein